MLDYFKSKKFGKNKADKEAAKETTQTTAQRPESEKEDEKSHKPDIQTTADTGSDEQAKGDSLNGPERAQRPSSDQPPLSPVLDKDDESWLRSILEDDSPPPPLPPRIKTPEITLSDTDSILNDMKSVEGDKTDDDEDTKGEKNKSKKEKEKEKKDKKEKEKGEKQPNRLSLLFSRSKKHGDSLKPDDVPVTEKEAEKETNDLSKVLDRLNLQAKNNKIVSLSNDSSDLLQRFTQVFKDLVNGVPTAVGDLTKLFEDRDGALNRGFEKLPSSLQKLVTQLPEKLTSSLAPELLAAAAESQGLKAEAEVGVKEAAKKLLTPTNLSELVTKPGAVVSMLKAIVNALKARWPAFMGTNVVWSVALFLLMFVLWYCHKRGREVRLEKEKADAEAVVDGSDRIEELPDDPLLPAPEPAAAHAVGEDPSRQTPKAEATEPVSPVSPVSPVLPSSDIPRKPIGQGAPAGSNLG